MPANRAELVMKHERTGESIHFLQVVISMASDKSNPRPRLLGIAFCVRGSMAPISLGYGNGRQGQQLPPQLVNVQLCMCSNRKAAGLRQSLSPVDCLFLK